MSLLALRRLAALLAAMAAMPAGAATTPLSPGEELVYSVRWALLPSAGQIRIAAQPRETPTGPQLSVTTETATRGLARSLVSFRAESESLFDRETGRILSLREHSLVRAKETDYAVTFDHAARRAVYAKAGAEPRELALPDGDPADLITTLMKTRHWDLAVGESRDVLVSFRHEFYLLTVHAVRTETVNTPLGRFEALVLEPRMEKSPPKGMFKRGAEVRVWITQDAARLPVRFQVEFKIGTGTATLVSYTPPHADSDARIPAED